MLGKMKIKMDDSNMLDRWLSVEEIAEYLGISKDTVYAWITKKNMPAHRVGRFWKFQRSEVDEWIKTGAADESKVEGED
jgi:excisionase family DNA binding protein